MNELTITADGSLTYFNTQYQEHYHNRSGAYTETMDVYIHPSRFEERLLAKPSLTLLDPFFGLGYITFLAWQVLTEKFETLKSHGPIHLIGIESDPEILTKIPEIFEKDEYQFLKKFSEPFEHNTYYQTQGGSLESSTPVIDIEADGVRFTLYLGDTRKVLPALPAGQIDIVYHDAFSPRKQPELWSRQIFEEYRRLVTPEGSVLTYCAAAPVRKAMQLAGFEIYAIPTLCGKNGTQAVVTPQPQLPSLTSLELALLTCRSALPYEDSPTMDRTPEEIHILRDAVHAASSLPTSSSIHKVYGNFSRNR